MPIERFQIGVVSRDNNRLIAMYNSCPQVPPTSPAVHTINNMYAVKTPCVISYGVKFFTSRHVWKQSQVCVVTTLLCLRPYRAEALSDAFVWRLSRILGLTREQTQRSMKTKIDTGVAHVTRDSDTTFKVKRSKVNLLVSQIANMPEEANKYEYIVNLKGAEAYCVATRTACWKTSCWHFYLLITHSHGSARVL